MGKINAINTFENCRIAVHSGYHSHEMINQCPLAKGHQNSVPKGTLLWSIKGTISVPFVFHNLQVSINALLLDM